MFLVIDYITASLVGFLAAFLGLLAPSMLNMTVAKTSIERGKYAGIQFALGAALILAIHCSIALFFTKYLVANPQIIEKLKITAIFVFIGLSFFFYKQAKSEKTLKGKDKKGHPFFNGIGMALLNMLGIPFYLTVATLAESKGFLKIEMPYSAFFVTGAFIGDFSLFSLYAIFAVKVAEKASFFAKNINYILSGLFIILALTTFFHFF